MGCNQSTHNQKEEFPQSIPETNVKPEEPVIIEEPIAPFHSLDEMVTILCQKQYIDITVIANSCKKYRNDPLIWSALMDQEKKSDRNKTYLMYNTRRNNYDRTLFLLDNGADFTKVNYGYCALRYSIFNTRLINLFFNHEGSKDFIFSHNNKNQKNQKDLRQYTNFNTVLYHLLSSKRLDVSTWLIENSEKSCTEIVNINYNGEPILLTLIKELKQHDDINHIALLFKYGVDFTCTFEMQNSRGFDTNNTILHYAVRNKLNKLVEFICKTEECSSIINLKNNLGCTAIWYAVSFNYEEILKYLCNSPYININIIYGNNTLLDYLPSTYDPKIIDHLFLNGYKQKITDIAKQIVKTQDNICKEIITRIIRQKKYNNDIISQYLIDSLNNPNDVKLNMLIRIYTDNFYDLPSLSDQIQLYRLSNPPKIITYPDDKPVFWPGAAYE